MSPRAGAGERRAADRRLLRVREVAEYLAVSTMTVYRLIGAGELPAVRVGRSWRVAAADLEDYLARGAG